MAPQRPLSSVRMPVWLVGLLLVIALAVVGVAAALAAVTIAADNARDEVAREAFMRDKAIAKADCESDVTARDEVRTALINASQRASSSPATVAALDEVLDAQPPLVCVRRPAPEFYATEPDKKGS